MPHFSSSTATLVESPPAKLYSAATLPLYPDSASTDVVFIFPNEKAEEPYLCANIAELQKASPYWKVMFDSGFQESEKYLPNTSQWRKQFQMDITEVIKAYRKDKSMKRFSASTASSSSASVADSASPDTPIRYVVVTDADMHTYRTILHFIRGGKPGSTLFGIHAGSAHCKSVYILAHKLDIETARKEALDAYAQALHSGNALQELMSADSFLYAELKETAMNCALKHRRSISMGAKECIAKIGENGQVDGQQLLLTALELYDRVLKQERSAGLGKERRQAFPVGMK